MLWNNSHRFFRILFCTILLILVFCAPPSKGLAQYTSSWDEPLNLTDSPTDSVSASLVADTSGVVHLMWVEKTSDQENLIMYSRLKDDFWIPPVDIYIDGGIGVGGVRSAIGRDGMLHLVWLGDGGIKYAHAYGLEAGDVQKWSKPVRLVPAQNFLGAYDIVVNQKDGIIQPCVIYAVEIGSNSGIYVVCSKDEGLTWSSSAIVYDNMDDNIMVSKPTLAVGRNGDLHSVWEISNYPETYPPIGLNYANSQDGGVTWSNSSLLASGPYSDPQIMTRNEDEVHVVWSGTDVDRYKFHRWSIDSGESWYPIWRNEEVGGLTGWPSLVEDSQRRLHWLLVGDLFRLPAGTPKDIFYHTTWQNGIWEIGELVYQDTYSGQNMSNVSAVISLGNQLHAAAQTPVQKPGGDYQFDIFYFHLALDGPAIPPISLAEPTQALAAFENIATPNAESSSIVKEVGITTQIAANTAPVEQRPWMPVTAGLVPIIIILVGIMIYKSWSREK